MYIDPFNTPVEAGSYELLIKELNYLSLSTFLSPHSVICEPRQIESLEAIRTVPCVYCAADRKLLADIMRLAKRHLLSEDGEALIAGKVQSLKRYGYEVVTIRNMTDKVNYAYFIKTCKGLICFHAVDYYYDIQLQPLPVPEAELTWLGLLKRWVHL